MSNIKYANANDSPFGGAAVYRNLDVGVAGQVIKASTGRLYGWQFSNAASSMAYVKIYNQATIPTQADTPLLTLGVPPGGSTNLDLPPGMGFSAGLSIRATTAVADNSTAAPTTNDVTANVFYK